MDKPDVIRIANISGRYLVFDASAVAALRRQENVNGTLVGTAPQQPTQNIFLGLPVELRPEEVHALVLKNVAYIVDDVSAHQTALQDRSLAMKEVYIQSLHSRKQAAQRVFSDLNARKTIQTFERLAADAEAIPNSKCSGNCDKSNNTHTHTMACQTGTRARGLLGVTPTSCQSLVPNISTMSREGDRALESSFCRYLQLAGYFMTPGLRFGSQYSVYAGDPLRFHAHYMANEYAWNEDIPILDIVGGGRLATAVKKAFLLGSEQMAETQNQKPLIKTISVEWAGM